MSFSVSLYLSVELFFSVSLYLSVELFFLSLCISVMNHLELLACRLFHPLHELLL